MEFNIYVLGMAIFSLAIGLGLYIWLSVRRNVPYFYTTNLISWLLIALFVPGAADFLLFP